MDFIMLDSGQTTFCSAYILLRTVTKLVAVSRFPKRKRSCKLPECYYNSAELNCPQISEISFGCKAMRGET